MRAWRRVARSTPASADLPAPQLVAATSVDTVVLTFSEAIDEITAAAWSLFALTPSQMIVDDALGSGGLVLTLILDEALTVTHVTYDPALDPGNGLRGISGVAVPAFSVDIPFP